MLQLKYIYFFLNFSVAPNASTSKLQVEGSSALNPFQQEGLVDKTDKYAMLMNDWNDQTIVKY